MYKEIRWQEIQEIIKNFGKSEVNELASKLGVSRMTIRRDLTVMMQQGLIERTHGRAVLAKERNLLQSPILLRLYEQNEEKRAIAGAVAKMIKHNEKIYIAAGTTTYWVAKAIANRSDLTVVTNSLPVANLLALSKDMEVIVVGGHLVLALLMVDNSQPPLEAQMCQKRVFFLPLPISPPGWAFAFPILLAL